MAAHVGSTLCRKFVPGALRQTVPSMKHSALNFKITRFLMSRAAPFGSRCHLASLPAAKKDCPRSPYMPFGVRSIIITTDLPVHEKTTKDKEEDDEAEDNEFGISLSKKTNEERHRTDPGRIEP